MGQRLLRFSGPVLFLAVLCGSTWAYMCPRPQDRSHLSPSGRFRLDVSAQGHARLVAVGGTEAVAWERQLGFVPRKAWVRDDGRFVVTEQTVVPGEEPRDLVVLGAQGTILAGFRLEQLADKQSIRAAGWKCGAWWWVSVKAQFETVKGHEGFVIRRGRATVWLDLERLRLDRNPSNTIGKVTGRASPR